MARFRLGIRIGRGLVAVGACVALGLVVAACSSSPSARDSAFLSSSARRVIYLDLVRTGSTVKGSVRISELSATSKRLMTVSARITGEVKDGRLRATTAGVVPAKEFLSTGDIG